MILKYDDHGQPYEDPMEENKKLKERVKELESSLTTALEINDTYQRDNKKLKERAQEAEGEVTIVKGIGMNSPEMRALQKQKEILKAACKKAGARIKELEEDREVLKKDIDRLSEYNQNLQIMNLCEKSVPYPS